MTPLDFITPAGDLAPVFFPDLPANVDLEDMVTAWLADATARSDNPNAQRAWVYHRAYTTIANRLHNGLASESKGTASASLDPTQFRYWARKAADALKAYRAATIVSSVAEVRAIW